MNKKIMILGASILQLPAIKQAKLLGYDVVVVDINPEAIGFKENGIEKVIVSTTDVSNVIKAAKKYNINGIMTLASDMPMRTVAAVASELNLVGIDKETALNATNKAEMRKVLKINSVPIPEFYKASNYYEFNEFIRKFNCKFIVKPADNSGSRGVYLVDDLSKAQYAYEYSRLYSKSGDLVIEEYMEGPEVSVETLTINGVCHVIQVTDKLTTGSPHFVEMGHSQPSMLPYDVVEKIKAVAISANKAIGINEGPSHTEIIVTKDGPKIVEIGARLGGDCITSDLVPLSTGINMVDCCIKISLGEKPNITRQFYKGSAIRYFNQHVGIIKSIEGLEEAKKIDGISKIYLASNIGDKITEVDNSGSRIGFVIAQSESPDKAVACCKKALETIKVEII